MKKEPPSLQIDAFIIRTLELENDIPYEDISDRIWYSYGKFMTNDDIKSRIKVYFYDHSGNHLSLN